MQVLILVLHLMVALTLIGVVLLQRSEGGIGMGTGGGGGGSGGMGGMFTARGKANFMTRLTSGLALAFFCTSLSLAFLGSQDSSIGSVANEVRDFPSLDAPLGESDIGIDGNLPPIE